MPPSRAGKGTRLEGKFDTVAQKQKVPARASTPSPPPPTVTDSLEDEQAKDEADDRRSENEDEDADEIMESDQEREGSDFVPVVRPDPAGFPPVSSDSGSMSDDESGCSSSSSPPPPRRTGVGRGKKRPNGVPASATKSESRPTSSSDQEEEQHESRPPLKKQRKLDHRDEMMQQMLKTIKDLQKKIDDQQREAPAAAPPVVKAEAPPPPEVKAEAPAAAAAVTPIAADTADHVLMTREDAPAAFGKMLDGKIATNNADLAKLLAKLQADADHKDATSADAKLEAAREACKKANEELEAQRGCLVAIDRFRLDSNAWMSPNYTMREYCRKSGNTRTWWEDVTPGRWQLVAKTGLNDRVELMLKSIDPPQRTLAGESCSRGPACIVTPALKIRHVSVYPHGNKDSVMFTPESPADVKYQFDVLDHNICDALKPDYPDENPTDAVRFFKWLSINLRDEVGNLLYEKDGVASSVKTNFRNSLTAERKKNAPAFELQAEFRDKYVRSPVVIDKHGVTIFKVDAPVLRYPWPSEKLKFDAEGGYRARTQWMHDMYYKPPKRKVKELKEGEKPKTYSNGYVPTPNHKPMIHHDLPLYAARTVDDLTAHQATANGRLRVKPFTLVDWSKRSLRSDDVVHLELLVEPFDSNKDGTRTGVRSLTLNSIVLVGEAYSLDESRPSLPKAVDRSQCFVMATPYVDRGVSEDAQRRDQRPPDQAAVDHAVVKGQSAAVQEDPPSQTASDSQDASEEEEADRADAEGDQ